MPSKFSSNEQKIIKQKLIENGTELFSQFGFGKTSVQDITDATGISKGSFYRFFNSKEELLLDIFEEQEKFRNSLIQEIMEKKLDAETAIKQLFVKSLHNIEQNKIFQTVYAEKLLEKMVRKVTPERIKQHQEKDLDDTKKFIEHLQQNSNLVNRSPDIIVGSFRALFFITLYKNEIGPDIYDDVIQLIIEAIACGLTQIEE